MCCDSEKTETVAQVLELPIVAQRITLMKYLHRFKENVYLGSVSDNDLFFHNPHLALKHFCDG
jgi:hypothetical protein